MKMKSTLLVLLLGALACSTEAGGPRPISMGVRVTDATELELARACVRLPVLLGSRVHEKTPVAAAGFEIEMDAWRDRIEVRFPGAAEAGELVALEHQLEGGHSDQAAIVDRIGNLHTAYLFTGCQRADPEDDSQGASADAGP